MIGRTTRRSREQCLQAVASSLIVSAQKGHSIRRHARTVALSARRDHPPQAPAPGTRTGQSLRLRSLSSFSASSWRRTDRAFAPDPRAPCAATPEPRCRDCRSDERKLGRLLGKAKWAAHCGAMYFSTFSTKLPVPARPSEILDVDANDVFARRQFHRRHVNSGRLDKGFETRRQVHIGTAQVGGLDSVNVDLGAAEGLELQLQGRR